MKNYGKTSLAEFRAIIAIACILILSISIPALCDRFFRQPPSDQVSLSIEALAFSDSLQNKNKTRWSYDQAKRGDRKYPSANGSYAFNETSAKTKSWTQRKRPVEERTNVQCREFDPNVVVQEDLIAMGVNSYVAGNLVKYRNSGAKFRKAEDLKKIYGMDSTLFMAIAGCIQIEPGSTALGGYPANIDINTAGHEEWKSLPGIGDVLAQRVIKYRELLGGFSSVEQVAETYGLPPETMDLVRARLIWQAGPKKLDLNTALITDLAAHPYITQRQAEAIVNFRSIHGPFANTEDVLQIFSLNDTWFARIQPYLTCGSDSDDVSGLVVH
jgi:competence ComEA-like helix-hairpin-helix protein